MLPTKIDREGLNLYTEFFSNIFLLSLGLFFFSGQPSCRPT